jgi:antirestriction protein
MLNIFVNTWGNYNENGADGGEWLSLPMSEEELNENLKRIAEQMGDHDPEWAIHDYEWTCEWEGYEISEHGNIHELNEFIAQLDSLSEWEQKTYLAAIEIWGKQYVDIDDIDNYNLYTDISNNYDLGYYWAVESGCYDLSNMGHLANYFDYESFGRDIAIEADGGFTSYGFIERC